MYPNQQNPQQGQPGGYPPQPPSPQPPLTPGYGPQPEPTYAVDYLDQIAPAPPRQNFLSGSFGKIVVALGVVLVFAVGIIVALGNQKNTGSLEQVSVRVSNMATLTKSTAKNLKSGKLRAANSNFNIWLTNANRDASDLLSRAGVRKNQINKDTVAKEKAANDKLKAEFEDARLNAELDRVYAREMAYQAQLIKNNLDQMAKRGPAKEIRDWAKQASASLAPYQQAFENFEDAQS